MAQKLCCLHPLLETMSQDIIDKIRYQNDSYVAIHCRFGDRRKPVTGINAYNQHIETRLRAWLEHYHKDGKKPFIVMMVDRQDNKLAKCLQKDYPVSLTHDFITPEIKKKLSTVYSQTDVAEFLIQKRICEESDYFIGNVSSTVSVHIQYSRYLRGKGHTLYGSGHYFNLPNAKLHHLEYQVCLPKKETYTWNKLNWSRGHPVSWQYFFPDNVFPITPPEKLNDSSEKDVAG